MKKIVLPAMLIGIVVGLGLSHALTPSSDIQPALSSVEDIDRIRQNSDRYDWLIKQWIESGSGAFYSLTQPRHPFAPKKEMAWFLGLDEEAIAALSDLSDQTMAKVKEWETANVVYQEKSKERIAFELPALPMRYKEEFLAATDPILTPEQSKALAPTFNSYFSPMFLKRCFDAELIPPDGSILIEGSGGVIHKSASYDTRKRLRLKTWNIREDGQKSGITTKEVTFNTTADEKPWIAGRWSHLILAESPWSYRRLKLITICRIYQNSSATDAKS